MLATINPKQSCTALQQQSPQQSDENVSKATNLCTGIITRTGVHHIHLLSSLCCWQCTNLLGVQKCHTDHKCHINQQLVIIKFKVIPSPNI